MTSRYVWETVPRKRVGDMTMMEFVRMMERAGLAKWADDDLEWFEDHRHSQKFQAQYLDKLTRFREDLYSHEKTSMDGAMDRLRKQNGSGDSNGRSPRGKNAASRKPSREGGEEMATLTQEMNPARHLKLQQMKIERIQKQKRPKTPPKLDPLEGKKLMEPLRDERECRSAPDNKGKEKFLSVNSVDNRVTSSESLPNLSPRFSNPHVISDYKTKTITELQKLLQPSSSIPNVGRRAIKEVDRLLPLTLDARNKESPERGGKNTFIKQMSMYKKHPRTKLYQGSTFKGSLSQDFEKLELNAESYHLRSSLDSLLDKVARAQNTNLIHAPATTPVCSDDENEYASGAPCDEQGENYQIAATFVKYRLGKDEKQKPSHEFKNYVKKRRKERTCPKCQQRIKNFEAREKFMDEVSSACHKCNEMSLPKFKQNGMTAQTFLTVHTPRMVEQTTKDSRTSPSSSTSDSGASDPDPWRKRIVVQMPDIVLKPSSPVDDSSDKGRLYKSFRQNEYRQKEVQNLLEDVREINEKTDVLSEHLRLDESSVT